MSSGSWQEKNIHPAFLPPSSPDLAPADYYNFPVLSRKLAGLSMTLEEFKKKREGLIRTLTKDNFARHFKGGCTAANSVCVSEVDTLRKIDEKELLLTLHDIEK
jgi:hypothetical protein